ncbi:MAG: 30S ribosomal protein S12 methylthiotransferase RimO [Lachnospiraceae bacterium]|nr:30S ribosomal protein S12 methylthiotransferase RimO [Lachnospiraceae bacterium]
MNVLFVSLGCDKNLVDSERMLGILKDKGYEFTDEAEDADVIVVNSCCFIGDAKEESINTILELGAYRIDPGERCKALIVTGCLAQRYADEIRSEIPEVDAVIGTTAYDSIAEVLEKVLGGEYVRDIKDIDRVIEPKTDRIITTGGYYSYLKIAEGCDKHCTYCIIPGLRGHYRSVPTGELVKEARMLVSNGVKELILVAQEITLYGSDLYGEKRLPDLLRELCAIEGLEWIRLLYCYPEEITDELIQVIKDEPKVCHYLDMPIQHASDDVLKRMGRKTDSRAIRAVIEKLRREIPDIAIRTTLISGFPGESLKDHEILKDFVREIGFERLGVFEYSPEEGTPAAGMEGQIDDDIKASRRGEIMELQQQLAYEKAKSMTGRRMDVLIEGRLVEEDVYTGRTYMDAPDVDGMVFVKSDRELLSGDIVSVYITGADNYDLIGELDDEPA